MDQSNQKGSAVGGTKPKGEENRSPFRLAIQRFLKNRMAMTGLVVVLIFTFAAIFAPLLSPYDRDEINVRDRYQPPSEKHLFGADDIGRDVFTRFMHAGRISLLVGVMSTLITTIIGMIIGALAGFYGGIIDMLLMRIADIVSSLPFYVIAITVMTMFNPGVEGTIMVMGILWWTSTARLLRSQILSLREREFMEATTALGIADIRKILEHLFPNAIGPIIVAATLNIAYAILTESALSYLGLGIRVPVPSWGNMLSNAQNMYVLQNYWWMWVPPGLAIFFVVMSFNFIGDGLRDALDPKLDV